MALPGADHGIAGGGTEGPDDVGFPVNRTVTQVSKVLSGGESRDGLRDENLVAIFGTVAHLGSGVSSCRRRVNQQRRKFRFQTPA